MKKESYSFFRMKKFNIKENSDGTVVYKNSYNSPTLILYSCLAVFVFALFVMMDVYKVNDLKSSDFLIQTFIGIVLLVILGIVIFNDAVSYMLKADSVVIKRFPWKVIEVPYSSVSSISAQRRYNKYHSYMSTKYIFSFYEGSFHEVAFCSRNAYVVADFWARISKKIDEKNNRNQLDASLEFVPRSFAIPKSTNNHVKKLIFIGAVFALFLIGIYAYLFKVFWSITGARSLMIPIYICFGLIMFAACCYWFSKAFGREIPRFPSNIEFGEDYINVDGKVYRKDQIKCLYVTSEGTGNPEAGDSSTFDIGTHEGIYRYCLGVFFPDERKFNEREIIIPDWRYKDFYNLARTWCKVNGIEFREYSI